MFNGVANSGMYKAVLLITLQFDVNEGTVAQFTILSRRLSGSTEDNHGKSQVTIMAETGTEHLQSTAQLYV